MAVRPFDGAVLMCDTTVVAARRHAIMRAERLITGRPVGGGIALEIAERGGQAVAAVLPGRAAERPERVLQALRQRHETLAAKHRMDMLKAAEGQPEVIEPMGQCSTSDGDAEISHVGEVRQSHPPRLVVLTEDHLPRRPVQRSPLAHAAFQGPPDPLTKLRVAAQELAKDRHRPQAWCRFQHRNNLGIEDPGQRIGPPPVMRRTLLRGRPRILLDPIACGGAESGPGGGDRRRVRRSILHE